MYGAWLRRSVRRDVAVAQRVQSWGVPVNVSRRAVLGSIVAGVGVIALTPPSQAASPAAPVSRGRFLGVTALETVTLRTFDEPWTTEWALTVPVSLEISGHHAGPLQATVDYDPRLLDVVDTVVLTAAGSFWTVTPDAPVTLPDGAARTRFLVEPPAGGPRRAEAVVASLPLRARELPAENVGAPLPFSLTIARPGAFDRAIHRSTTTAEATAVRPWAAEVAAGWGTLEVVQAGRPASYLYPLAASVTGAGPHPVPAGAPLTIEVDAALVTALGVNAVRLDGVDVDLATLQAAPAEDDTVRRLTVAVPVEIPAGSVLEVELAPVPVDGAETVRALRFATVGLSGTGAPDERVRESGTYLATSLTPSGRPAIDGVAVGTV